MSARRDTSFGTAVRVVAVVALLAGAALALEARQGLDWDALADPVRVRWARVVLGLVLLAAVVSVGRRLMAGLLHRLRKPRRPPDDERRTEPEAEPFPLLLRVVAAVLVLAAAALAWFIIDAVTGPVPVEQVADSPAEPSDAEPGADTSTGWPALVLVAAVLLAALTGARLLAARVTGTPEPQTDAGTDQRDDAAELSAAVRAAETELVGHDDARAAIVAAYTAMAASIGAGLRRRGQAVRASDTPTELLDRAAGAGLVEGGPAATLTTLFREARFSRHPMGDPERRAAEQALAKVRDELAARRA